MTRPTITNALARDMLVKARDLFVVKGHGMCQRAQARTDGGDPTYVDAERAKTFSLTGSLIWAAKEVGTPWINLEPKYAGNAKLPAMIAVDAVFDALIAMRAIKPARVWTDERTGEQRVNYGDPYHALANWNDAEGRETRHVVNLLGLVLGFRLHADPDLAHPGPARVKDQGLEVAALQVEPPMKATTPFDPYEPAAGFAYPGREVASRTAGDVDVPELADLEGLPPPPPELEDPHPVTTSSPGENPDPWGLHVGFESDEMPPPPPEDDLPPPPPED